MGENTLLLLRCIAGAVAQCEGRSLGKVIIKIDT